VINEGQTAVAGWRRVLDILDVEPDVADPGEDGRDLPPGPVGVRFDHVSFRYRAPGRPAGAASGPFVLHDVDLDDRAADQASPSSARPARARRRSRSC
jgi:ATP-binding cassette, subfamily B, bacterial